MTSTPLCSFRRRLIKDSRCAITASRAPQAGSRSASGSALPRVQTSVSKSSSPRYVHSREDRDHHNPTVTSTAHEKAPTARERVAKRLDIHENKLGIYSYRSQGPLSSPTSANHVTCVAPPKMERAFQINEG